MVCSGTAKGGILFDGCAELPGELLLVGDWCKGHAEEMGVKELRELIEDDRQKARTEGISDN